jgi:hypothetical protein
MSINLLTGKPSPPCSNCLNYITGDGECPQCGTYWWGGIGYRVEWEPGGAEAFVRDMQRLADKAGLPPGSISIVRLHPRDLIGRADG